MRGVAVSLAVSLLLSGCGLGMSAEDRLARAEEAFAAGELRAAIIDAKNVLLDQPDNADARLLLGRASLAAGDGETAEKELRRAVELGVPFADVAVGIARARLQQRDYAGVIEEFASAEFEDAAAGRELHGVLGDAYLGLRQPKSAREHYSTVVADDPAARDARLGVALSYVYESDFVKAREALTRILESEPDFARAWLTSARLYMSARHFSAAVADFERARELARDQDLESTEIEAVYGLADASLSRNRLEDAGRYAGMLETLAPNSIATLQTAGRLAYARGEWQLAQENLTEVLRRAPEHNVARTTLGAVHLQSGNLGQAEMHLSAAVSADPRDIEARRLLAETRLKLNKAEGAQLALQPLVDSADADARSLAMAARVELLSGDFERAAGYLERSAADEPMSPGLQLDLAMAYLLAGRTEEAQEILDRTAADASGNNAFRRDALQVLATARTHGEASALAAGAELRDRWPEQVMAHVLHGGMLMSTGDNAAARSAFNEARELEPDNAAPLRYLARLDESEENWAQAEARYREVLESQPDDAGSMFALGRIAARNEDLEGAIDWLEQSRAAAESAVAPRLVLAKLYLAQRRPDDAQAVAREALAINDEVAELHELLGRVQLSEQNYTEAADRFSRALELDPDNAGIRASLARAQTAGGNARQALGTLEESGGDTLAHLPSGILLANAKVSEGDVEGALATARALRERHPGSALPLALEAEILAGSDGDVERAVTLYDEALAKEMTRRIAVSAYSLRRRVDNPDAASPLRRFLAARPLDTEVRVLLAQDHHRLEQRADAAAEYERVLDAEPDNFVALNNLAWLYFKGDDPRAENLARRAHELQPDNASVTDTLGWILVENGKVTEGIEFLRAAVEQTDRPEVRYHLAAALAAAGENGEARQLLEAILESDGPFPSRNEAQNLLASL